MPRPFIRGSRTHVTSKKTYTRFKKANPDINITFDQFKEVLNQSNTEISNVILTDKMGFKMPYSLGHLVVSKYKQYKPIVDRGTSKKLQKEAVYTNFHTLGHMFSINWYCSIPRTNSNFNLARYRFNATRDLKRNLAKILKAGGYNNYLDLRKSNFYDTTYNKIKS